MTLPITVCIPVKNEEENLPSSLDALGDFFARIIVIDSGSSDRTRKIAEDRGIECFDFSWDGQFPKKRNWALRHAGITTPWVFFLDADERVTSAFFQELEAVLPSTMHAGFWIAFDNWFMGQPLRHGDTFRKLSLFRVGSGEYERFPEDYWSHLDMEVHEHPVIEGSIGEIQHRLEHRDYRGMKHYLAKHNEYSSWEANRFRWLMDAGEEEWNRLNRRQRFKYQNLAKWWLGPFYFLISYVLKRGFLDGREGWTFARLKMRYFNEIYLKIRELES